MELLRKVKCNDRLPKQEGFYHIQSATGGKGTYYFNNKRWYDSDDIQIAFCISDVEYWHEDVFKNSYIIVYKNFSLRINSNSDFLIGDGFFKNNLIEYIKTSNETDNDKSVLIRMLNDFEEGRFYLQVIGRNHNIIDNEIYLMCTLILN